MKFQLHNLKLIELKVHSLRLKPGYI